MGFPVAHVSTELQWHLRTYLDQHPVGFLAGADALIELLPKLVRGPDLCFVSWEQLPDRKIPADQICKLIPDLVVEVLSPSNTRGEMTRKRKEYFLSGVKLVWILDPRKGTAEVYTSPEHKTRLAADGVLDGGEVLPGFQVALTKLVGQLDIPKPKSPRKPPRKKK